MHSAKMSQIGMQIAMTDNKEILELYKQHQTSHEKYTYFILAAAGAATGFAVQKTEGLHLSWWLAPAGLALVCWGISFYYGCKNVEWVQSVNYANYSLLQLRAGVHPAQPDHPERTQVAISGVQAALDGNVTQAQFYSIWQFRMLIAGAVSFIGWRVLEMVRLTFGL